MRTLYNEQPLATNGRQEQRFVFMFVFLKHVHVLSWDHTAVRLDVYLSRGHIHVLSDV